MTLSLPSETDACVPLNDSIGMNSMTMAIVSMSQNNHIGRADITTRTASITMIRVDARTVHQNFVLSFMRR